ncbi:16652_t:CDS:1 [Funneliformis geosporum]|uniref:15357_t:CDS:1 n=1 Tax=Funneliformis geosporum TaxID=1117311 RepID=A0A9W4WJ30_9GLOM|nr:15357_t:CDS:1 [Funneliformis geosporum]CAI2174404.1 16652_t:CDS:1 [Funneliformis geosporum]
MARNLLLIGTTGSGKSTLANVISDTINFKESEASVSETRDIQSERFYINGVRYNIIDTIGINDTYLTTHQVLQTIVNTTRTLRGGLNQILFVTDGRFTRVEITAYNLLKKVIFDEDVYEFTTIVRTRFPSFRDDLACDEDYARIINENEQVFDIVESCNKIIHVNNMTVIEDPDQNSRFDSREKLLSHLINCQRIYRPKNLTELNEKTKENMEEREILQQTLIQINERIEEIKRNVKKQQVELDKQTKESLKILEKIDSLNEIISDETEQHIESRNSDFLVKCNIM